MRDWSRPFCLFRLVFLLLRYQRVSRPHNRRHQKWAAFRGRCECQNEYVKARGDKISAAQQCYSQHTIVPQVRRPQHGRDSVAPAEEFSNIETSRLRPLTAFKLPSSPTTHTTGKAVSD